jgi:hypothetical protein
MTADAPTWGEFEKFLGVDGWIRLQAGSRGGRSEDHIFFEKVLPDGRVLQTHISHSRRGRPSAGRFGAILRDQLEVSREQFWTALHKGEPVDRPAALDESERVEHEAWVVAALARGLHMTAEQIAALSIDDAKQLVLDHWSRPTG